MSIVHVIQSVADSKFGHENFEDFPEFDRSCTGILKSLRLLRLFGEISFNKLGDHTNTTNSYFIRNDIKVFYHGVETPGIEVMKKLSPKHKYPDKPDVVFTRCPVEGVDNEYSITDPSGVRHLKLKLHMDDELLDRVCQVIIKNSDDGSIVEMQADSHSAGDIFVGMVMVFDNKRIPISMVSADIGCGLTLLPIVEDEKHVNVKDVFDLEKFKMRFLVSARTQLKRGKVAETGQLISELVYEALDFYDDTDICSWLNNMKYILEITGLWREAKQEICGEKRINSEVTLTPEQNQCLRYVGRYSQTLGSSGNHFMELSRDDEGYIWAVVHSGSRRLGAMIYSCISSACKFMNNGDDFAIGELSEIYCKAYDVLNKFARLNRAMCAVSVMKALSLEFSGKKLSSVLLNSWLFRVANSEESKNSSKALLSGLCHNGISAFVNHETKQILYVLSKGAIAVTTRSSSCIVALKAGEGCLVFVLSDPENKWMEISMEESNEFVVEGYEVNPGKDYWKNSVVFAGHGAGRKQATSITENEFKFEDLVEFFGKRNVVSNVAPGNLGDHPDGYKDTSEIIDKLPLDISISNSYMRTLTSYKEGLPIKGPKQIKRLAGYVKKNWNGMTDKQKECIDLKLILSELSSQLRKEYTEDNESILAKNGWIPF